MCEAQIDFEVKKELAEEMEACLHSMAGENYERKDVVGKILKMV